ncbi:MAG: flavodoxin [Duncaniella sp.]|nr:flavodoxin [Duncaniella sp.]
MKRYFFMLLAGVVSVISVNARTLVVYYSYTENVHKIVTALSGQIEADVVRIQPAEKGLDYEANNYAIGSAQIAAIRNNPDDAASYPAIDPVDVNLSDYDCIIIGAPLWWSQMAAPLQTFLFQHGAEMAGKRIGLIVSSASSGISGVEADARRLIPDGDFFRSSLWIRSSQTSNAASLLSQWLKDINYDAMTGINEVADNAAEYFTVYSLGGTLIGRNMATIDNLKKGLYVVNGMKIFLRR